MAASARPSRSGMREERSARATIGQKVGGFSQWNAASMLKLFGAAAAVRGEMESEEAGVAVLDGEGARGQGEMERDSEDAELLQGAEEAGDPDDGTQELSPDAILEQLKSAMLDVDEVEETTPEEQQPGLATVDGDEAEEVEPVSGDESSQAEDTAADDEGTGLVESQDEVSADDTRNAESSADLTHEAEGPEKPPQPDVLTPTEETATVVVDGSIEPGVVCGEEDATPPDTAEHYNDEAELQEAPIDSAHEIDEVPLTPDVPTLLPPAPVHVGERERGAQFSGSLNPHSIPENGDDDSDSDSDDNDNENHHDLIVEPLDWGASKNADDDDELEVDPVIADAIRTAKADAQATATELRPALSFGADEIALSFEPANAAPTGEVIAHVSRIDPESCAAVFGINYQSMRARGAKVAQSRKDDIYSLPDSWTFHDFETDLSLPSDASLTTIGGEAVVDGDEDDEFGCAGHGEAPTPSPPLLGVTLEKLGAPHPQKDKQESLLEELKRQTVEEKRANQSSQQQSGTEESAITLKELHSIYKRGLGDQEVLMMDEPSNERNNSASTQVIGVLDKTSISKQPITEEAEEDERDEREEREQIAQSVETLDDEDLNAVQIDSEGVGNIDQDEGRIDEWREIELQRGPTNAVVVDSKVAVDHASKISYADAERYFMESDDILVHKDRIVAEELGPSSSCFGCLSRPRLTFSGAIDQRDRLFCAAATSFDARNSIHVKMLQTIFRKLTGASADHDVGLIGPHWESIGFQGNDPSTDLRGCGVLSLLQMLNLVETNGELARRFLVLSQHPVRHFPMACAFINITLQCVTALRSGALYRECNKRASVFDVANALHAALTVNLTKELQASGDQIPLVMKRVLDDGRYHPDKVLNEYGTAQELEQQRGARGRPSSSERPTAGGRPSSSHAPAEFTEIALHSVSEA